MILYMNLLLMILTDPPQDSCGTYIKFIIAMGAAITAMGAYIVKRESSREKNLIAAYEGRIADNKEHYDLVETLLRVIDTEREKRKGGP